MIAFSEDELLAHNIHCQRILYYLCTRINAFNAFSKDNLLDFCIAPGVN